MAILSNYDHVLGATETALNSAGSATQENAKYMESLSAKLTALSATFESFSNNVLSSDLVGGILDIANALLKLVNTPVGTAVTQFLLLTGVLTGLTGVFGPIVGKIGGVFQALAKGGGIVKTLTGAFTGLKTALASGAGGFAAVSAAAVPVAGIISAVVVGVELAVSAFDAFTVSAEEQAEVVSSLKNDISGLQSEYDNLSQKTNKTADEERRLKVLKAQIEANEKLLVQETQKQYDKTFGKKGVTGETDLEVLADDINKLKGYQSAIEQIDRKIVKLNPDTEDYTKRVQELTKRKEELTEKFTELNSEVSSSVKTLSEMGDTIELSKADEEVIDSYNKFSDSLDETTESAEKTGDALDKLSKKDIKPVDFESFEQWAETLNESQLSDLEFLFDKIGTKSQELSDILSNMSGEQAIAVVTKAVQMYNGEIIDATQATSEFEEALNKDYAEGAKDLIVATDYIQKSQTEGIQNLPAYKKALEAVYGTANKEAIELIENQAQINTDFNDSGSTLANYMSYYQDGEIDVAKFVDQLKRASTEYSDLVKTSGSLETGDLEIQIEDFDRLAEIFGLNESQLKGLIDTLQLYGEVNVGETVDANVRSLQKMKDGFETISKGEALQGLSEINAEMQVVTPTLEDVTTSAYDLVRGLNTVDGSKVSVSISAEEVEPTRQKLTEVQDQINELTSKYTGIELDFDIEGMDEKQLSALYFQLQDYITKMQNYVSDAGWDFSGIAEGMEGVTVEGDTIKFDTDEAAINFENQFLGSLKDTKMGEMLSSNLVENMKFDTSNLSEAGKSVIDGIVAGANQAASTNQIAFEGILTSLDASIGNSKQVVTELTGAFTDASGEADILSKKDFGKLNGSLGETVTNTMGVNTQLGIMKSYIDGISGNHDIIINYKTTGNAPTLPTPDHRAVGQKGDGTEQPLRATSSKTSLVGEEGEELLIRSDGTQEMIGVNGAEFRNINKGDTIIPADVTAMIKNGKIGAYGGGVTSGTRAVTGTTSLNISLGTSSKPIKVGELTSLYDNSVIKGSGTTDKNTSSVKKNTSAKNESAQATKKATDANEELNDALEEQKKLFDEQNDILEHQIFIREKQGASTEELVKLNKQYQKQLHDQANWYRKQGLSDTSEEIRELQKSWWSLEDDITDLQRDAFEERLKLSEDYIDDRNDFNDWGADSEVDAWKRVLEWQEEWYKKGLIDYETYCEKHKEATKNLIKAEKEAWKKAKEEEIDRLETQQDAYEALFDIISDKAQEEIDKLQEERDTVEKYWNDKIEALQKVNEELDEQLEHEEALDALARARQTKVMVYKDGRFQYINDTDAVSEAKENLNKIEREQKLKEEIERLEANRDKELEVLDKKIKDWEKFEEEWQKLLDHYQDQQKENLIKEQLNIDKQEILNKMEAKNWQDRINNLTQYVSQYEALMDRLAQAQKELEEMQEQSSGGGNFSSSGAHTGAGIGTGIGSVIGGPGGGVIGGVLGTTIGGMIGGAVSQITGGSSGGKHHTVDSSGNAPSSAKPGDIVHTGGGNYQVVKPNTPGASYNPSSGKWSVKLAKGTKNATGGMALVGENGPEMRILNRGDGVIPTNLTNNLWKWGQFTPHDLINHTFATDNNGGGTSITIQNFNPNLSGVKDGEGFVEYMKHNFARSVVQFVGRRG